MPNFRFGIINDRMYNHKTHILRKFNAAIANRVSAAYDGCGAKFTMHNTMLKIISETYHNINYSKFLWP